jgi:hypothetical protein
MEHVRLNDPQTASGVVVLVFQGAERLPPGRIGAVLRDIESLYWFCLEVVDPELTPDRLREELRGMSRRDRVEALWEAPKLHLGVERLRLGSPLEVVLQVGADAWQVGAGLLFTGALAMVFRMPARFQEARRSFWDRRLAADDAKRKWLESKRAEWEAMPPWLSGMRLPEEAEGVLRERGEEP